MKIAAIQMQSGLDPDANLAALEPMIAEAAEAGASYALTPEVTLIFPESRDQLRSVAAPFEGHPQLARVGELARQHKMHVHIGSLPIPLEDGRFANRSVLFGPDGAIVAHYDKIHLFDADIAGLNAYRESATYKGGDRAVTAPLGDFTLGFSICYDMRFPRLYNSLANAGADLIAVPAAFTVPTGQAHWHVLLRARAIETGSYVIAAAQGGQHANGRATYGHSLVIDPWGKVIAELDHDAPGVLLADIDPALVREARQRVPALANARDFAAPEPLQG
ncbi:MAG: carbon-nitrogen hydrolase family protein [Devosia sp.]|uniref:carbon-nitrogen hydrolase family protein n=1 Tax=unclassified Devosia TaxID=196773 RepID=UPI001A06CBD7|nr:MULTISPECIES: carbon-nitrogen hydrolase family protein [unclassified Devosia]MBF0679149.1 carbon-nitrogen hydrolase family protein [Devosia sp.]WEJ33762.1 carbon-nitrogen hydrolase family protein [Devosia sp. SD17-2]